MAKKKIIACQIFTDELLAVLPEEYRDIDINWIDAGLHSNIDKLEIALKQALKDSAAQGEDSRVFRVDTELLISPIVFCVSIKLINTAISVQ